MHEQDCFRFINKTGISYMGYGSKYENNRYRFSLLEGWYCLECLDSEVAQDLAQPIIIYRRDENDERFPLKCFTYDPDGRLLRIDDSSPYNFDNREFVTILWKRGKSIYLEDIMGKD